MQLSNINLAHKYTPEPKVINPSYKVMHHELDSSMLYISIPSEDLLYSRSVRDEYFTARFALTIRIFNDFDNKKPFHVRQISFTDTLIQDDARIIHKAAIIPLLLRNQYSIHLLLEDQNRKSRHESIIRVDKQGRFSSGFFSIKQQGSTNDYNYPFVVPTSLQFTVSHSRIKEFSMQVNRHPLQANIPVAPYVLSDEGNLDPLTLIADSSFVIEFSNGKTTLAVSSEGSYHFFEPGNPANGFTINSFWNGYPEMPSDNNLLKPLRYITSISEYNALLDLGSPTLAAERFWTRITGNPDRALSVMKRYNSRVVFANQRFSSHLPGWQTDMGMIFIIFGTPDMVLETDDSETWYYSEGVNNPATEFKFVKTENSLSDRHLVLIRDQKYRNSWNQAVDKWRR
jgi:GWxTD domain-containing protein